jgi:hypothetical protein
MLRLSSCTIVSYLSFLSVLRLCFPVGSMYLILIVLYPLLCIFCLVMCFMILYDALCSDYTRFDIYESQPSTTVGPIRRPTQHITSKVDPSSNTCPDRLSPRQRFVELGGPSGSIIS